MKEQILLVGGDRRTPYAAAMLQQNNLEISLYGFETLTNLPMNLRITKSPVTTSTILFPIPTTQDGKTVFAPYGASPIFIEEILEKCQPHTVFGGNLPLAVTNYCKNNKIAFYDYGKNEIFALKNALPTAEATIEIIMQNTPYVLEGTSVCIVGYGRIGKILATKLKALGCHVTQTARKEAQLAEIKDKGYFPLSTESLATAPPFDILINTVPHLVVDKKVIDGQQKNTLMIDLASKPGGIDFAYAREKGIHTIHALSLPAKHAPQTAGKIVAETILEYLHETE